MALADSRPTPGDEASTRPERPDAFISYSRRDQSFVDQRLVPALVERGKDVWVDREDIEPAADWRERIGSGIERATAFAFVLTPDSMRSPICADELAQAVAANKRLVPILRRPVDGQPVPEALERTNWIWLRDEDDFDVGMAQIVEALETDLAWRDAHARLAARASEWGASERDDSFLLRGTDLQAAEAWLADQHHHREAPTDEQVAYILASRRASKHRLRRLFAAVVLALAVTAVLAVLALVAQQQASSNEKRAVANERRAVSNERTARSRELAATALLTSRNDPRQAVALASEANRVAPTDQALTALRQSLEAWPARGVFTDPHGALTGAAYSPNGRFVVTSGESVRVWSTTSRRLLSEHKADDLDPGARFSPDSRRLLTATESAVVVRDTRSGEPVLRLRTAAPLNDARFDPTGRRLVLTAGDRVSVRDSRTGKTLAGGRIPGWTLDAAAMSRDGRHLLARGNDYRTEDSGYAAILWRLPATRPVLVARHREPVTAAVFSPAGDRFVSASDDDTAQLWQLAPLRRTLTIRARYDITDASFSRDGGALLTSGLGSRAQVTDTATGRRLALATVSGVGAASAFSPDGRNVAVTSQSGGLSVWDVARDRRVITVSAHRGDTPSVAFSPDGASVLTAGKDGRAVEWQPHAGARVLPLRAGGKRVRYADLSPDGRLALTAPGDRAARVWDVPTGRLVRVLRPGDGSVVVAAEFTGGSRSALTIGKDGSATVWDVASGRARHRFRERFAPTAVWGSEDHGRVLLTRPDGAAAVWDTAQGRRVSTLDGPGRKITTAAFSPDGKRLMTAAISEPTRLWDAATGAHIRAFGGDDHVAYGAALSRDGRFVVNAEGFRGLRVYATSTGKRTGGLRGSTTSDVAPRFSAGGAVLVTAGSLDEASRVYDWKRRRIVRTIAGQHRATELDRSGRYLATADNRSLAIWDVRTGERVLRHATPHRVVVMEMAADAASVVTLDGAGLAQVVACDHCGSREALLRLAAARGAGR